VLVGSGKLDGSFHQQLLGHAEPSLRAWGVRAAGNFGKVDDSLRTKIVGLSRDESRDVQLQVAIAARKLEGVTPLPVLVDVLAHSGDDPLIPHIVWQNLHPLLADHGNEFLAEVKKHDLSKSPNLKAVMPRAAERMLATKKK
jgi:hypothetical protein